MLLVLLLTFVQAADADPSKVIERINAHRNAAGLEPVAVDPSLSTGCAAHASYLVKNVGHPSTEGLGLHSEDPKLPGYSKEGERAGKASVIFLGLEGEEAVDGWMGSLFHRIPLLQSRLRKIGYGVARGGPAKVTVVLDATNGMGAGKDSTVVLYPAEDQKEVPPATRPTSVAPARTPPWPCIPLKTRRTCRPRSCRRFRIPFPTRSATRRAIRSRRSSPKAR